MSATSAGSDLFLLENAAPLVTMNERREVHRQGWVAAAGGLITAVGEGTPPEQVAGRPRADHRRFDAAGAVVLPGLVNTHHHLFQSRTRAHPAALDAGLFDWLVALYPVWAHLREDDVHRAAVVVFRELLRSGCTLTSDHHYLFPAGARPDLIDVTIAAARDAGIRFHPTRGSMSRSQKDGGLPPDDIVQDEDEILADSERLIDRYHDARPGAMIRLALAPCSPFNVSPELMRETAALARRHGVRLHTHLAETLDEERYCLEVYGRRPLDFIEDCGWLASDVWLAHGIHFDDREIARLGAAGVGISHCPTSNMRLGSGVCRVRDLQAAGCPVGLAVDGSASNDGSNLLAELRQTLLLHRVIHGPNGMTVAEVLEMATRGGAACLGREDAGALEPGRACDLAVFDLSDIGYDAAGDRVAALVLCQPAPARAVVVGGRVIDVQDY
ncbi:MAG: 8-oxoguanine deaminase [Candidatus Krumholzibacteriia bacterium]